VNQVVNKGSNIYRTVVIFCGCTFVSGLDNILGNKNTPQNAKSKQLRLLTLHTEKSNKMQQFIKIYYSIFI